MCGIVIAKDIETTFQYFEAQRDRGLDSVGIISLCSLNYYRLLMKNEESNKVWNTLTKKWEYPNGSQIEKYKKEILSWIQEKKLVGPYVLHHRKASMGSVTLENCHPFYYKEKGASFFLMQNGTTKQLGDYAETMAIHNLEYKDKSDTWTLGKLICDYPNHKDEYLNMSTGVKVIVDVLTSRIEIYGDKQRSFFIDKKKSIFASTDEGQEYDWSGYATLDFDLNLLDHDYEQTEKKKIIVQQHLPFQSHNIYGGYGYEDYGYGYSKKNEYLPEKKKEEKKDTGSYTETEQEIIDIMTKGKRSQKDIHNSIRMLRQCNGNIKFEYDPEDIDGTYNSANTFLERLRKSGKSNVNKLESQIIKREYDFYLTYFSELNFLFYTGYKDTQDYYAYCLREIHKYFTEYLEIAGYDDTDVIDGDDYSATLVE